MITNNKSQWIGRLIPIIFFVSFAYLTIFLHLGSHSFRMWDEAIYAVNAFEMSQNNNFICRHFEGNPTLWNPKPPLATWIQVLAFKIFGYSELVFRLPVALFSLFTALLMIYFGRKQLGVPMFGYLSALILLSSSGYIHFHLARTGDPDAVLAFFVLAYSMVYYKFLTEEDRSEEKKYYFLFLFLLVCAFMTKSIAGLFILPALFVFTIIKGKIKPILSKPYFYIGILIALTPVILYYWAHEVMTPGFIESALGKESGRFAKVIQHKQSFGYYFEILWREKFHPWFLLIPLSLVFLLNEQNRRLRDAMLYIIFISINYFFVVSLAKTKLPWYLASLYPFLSLIAGYVLYRIFNLFLSQTVWSKSLKMAMIYLLVIMIFGKPLYDMAFKNLGRSDRPGELYAYYLKKLNKAGDLDQQILLHNSMNPHVSYYKGYYNLTHGRNIKSRCWEGSWNELKQGDVIISCDYTSLSSVQNRFETQKVSGYRNCEQLKIVGRKIQDTPNK